MFATKLKSAMLVRMVNLMRDTSGKRLRILSIETSCDETAVAILECYGGFKNPNFTVLGDTVVSQASKHAEFGGVYPTLAKREHQKNLVPALLNTLTQSGIHVLSKERAKIDVTEILEREPDLLNLFQKSIPNIEKPDIDAIAVTAGPGLEPALWVGINFAKALGAIWNLPVIAVNHMDGHIVSVLAKNAEHKKTANVEFPAVALLISGGHTELVLVRNWLDYKVIGKTKDDAVGEVFDKVARILSLPYPGGPHISKLAEKARQDLEVSQSQKITLPRPMIHSGDFDFSFSGLKTAVLYLAKKMGTLDDQAKSLIAREFEDAVTDVMIKKTFGALEQFACRTIIVGGGVIANTHLRKELENEAKKRGVDILIPPLNITTDNAVMIGMAAYFNLLGGKTTDPHKIEARDTLTF